jgi:hypothetical protein
MRIKGSKLCLIPAVLDEIKDEWDFVIDPDVRV